ncbi:MAG: hypothetical protein ACJ8EF_01450 [Bradyrhizobium sp.]|jgi:hypothetical protein
MKQEDPKPQQQPPGDEEDQIADVVERSYGRRMLGTETDAKTPEETGQRKRPTGA